MSRTLATMFVVASTLSFGAIAHAADAEFLKSLDGNWGGKGSVKVEADSAPINVSCKFSSDTTESSMALDGSCTGMVVVSRAIGATIKTDGKSYKGTYIGSNGLGIASATVVGGGTAAGYPSESVTGEVKETAPKAFNMTLGTPKREGTPPPPQAARARR